MQSRPHSRVDTPSAFQGAGSGGSLCDHLISLELGGSNSIKNVWPEHYYEPWGARTKDRLENVLHRMVCSEQITLAKAQREEATNWIRAYKGYVGDASASAPVAPSTSSSDVPASPPATDTTGGDRQM